MTFTRYYRPIVLTVAVFLFVCLLPADVWAQCPMCRISAESNLANGGTEGRGLNTGILYMFAMPYLLVGAIGYWWWRNRNTDEGDRSGDEPDARLN